jgi:hypothetical protein
MKLHIFKVLLPFSGEWREFHFRSSIMANAYEAKLRYYGVAYSRS